MKSIVLITNPNESGTEAGTISVQDDATVTPATVLREFGEEIENGALVTILDLDIYSDSGRAWQYIADTETGDAVRLRSNGTIADYTPLGDVGEVIAELEPEVELETFTVFGTNDDDEPFTAVITCDPAKVETAAAEAGATGPEWVRDVTISAILKGDQTNLVVA